MFSFNCVSIACAIIIVLVVVYLKWKLTFWQRRGIYCRSLLGPFGHIQDLLLQRHCIGESVKDVYDELKQKNHRYGGYYCFTHPIFIVADIELVNTILRKDFQHFTDHANFANPQVDPIVGHLFNLKGQQWKNRRAKLNPTFTSGKMKMMFETMLKCSADLEKMLTNALDSNKSVLIKDIAARFTNDMIVSVAFGIDANCLRKDDPEFVKYGNMIFKSTFKRFLVRLFFIMWPEVLNAFNISPIPKQSTDFIKEVTQSTVEYREKNNIIRNDFLHLLIQIKNSSELNENDQVLKSINGNGGAAKQNLTLEELSAEAYLFWSAGYETSSTTITFLMYELAKNVEIQENVRREIVTVLKNHDNEVTYDGIQDMPYTDRCIFETLRKYPPLPIHTRRCTQTYNIADSDVVLHKGETIFLPVLGIHYDPEFYPKPEQFDPDRFLPENNNKRPTVSWIPFGEGPRICPGARYGMIQIKMALTAMLKKYKFALNTKSKVPFKFDPKCWVLSKEKEIWLDVEKI